MALINSNRSEEGLVVELDPREPCWEDGCILCGSYSCEGECWWCHTCQSYHDECCDVCTECLRNPCECCEACAGTGLGGGVEDLPCEVCCGQGVPW